MLRTTGDIVALSPPLIIEPAQIELQARRPLQRHEQIGIGDGVALAHDPVAALQALVEDLQQSRALGNVTVTGTLVLVVLAGELIEETQLPEHRANTPHL